MKNISLLIILYYNKIYFLYPMTKVLHFTPQITNTLICSKGGSHQEQSLNLVCLDPLCRSNPLSCSVCFSQTHKYHKVVGLSKFIDDYKRNAASSNVKMLNHKINKHYNNLRQKTDQFKEHFMKQIEKFQRAIEKYAEHLAGQSHIRDCVGQQLHVELEPEKVMRLRSQDDLQRSLRFILNNSLYDSNLNMINTSEILKQNEDRVCALLDKMVYMTQFCQKSINQALDSLKFVNRTLKQQKIQINKKIDKAMNAESDPTSLKLFGKSKQQLKKIIEETNCLVLEQLQKVEHAHQWDYIPSNQPKFLFGKYRSMHLQLDNQGTSIKSNIQSEKHQYALGWPNLNCEPLNTKKWFLKIKNCRDFASQNTMAVGISKVSDMKLSGFEGSPKNCLMISSQGYVSLNGKIEKTNFVYRQGDVLSFSYDPQYGILEVGKQNGRKLVLSTLGVNEPVYPCVRFTYSSDQVQFI